MNARVESASGFVANGVKRPWRTELVGLVHTWVERSKGRRELASMSDHMLKDIGVSRAQAWVESNKPFWRA